MTTAHAHHPRSHASQRVALFGGTFDPVHVGHLAVAMAAQRRFRLDQVHFVPCGRPPHKLKQELAPYLDRYAMVSLAVAEHLHFYASRLEAGEDLAGRHIHYSVETVR
ncbi:MAG: adenylyltransferase/cytidyltransferase family protein, partial [Acidobacteria bacterium]|nr:adenylyltransferase/cytidyltransferase family protein [Acidobacteriota bacterium]